VYQVIWRCDINKKWTKERHSGTETKPPITLLVVPQATLVAVQEEEAKIKENKEEKWATKNKETYSLKKKKSGVQYIENRLNPGIIYQPLVMEQVYTQAYARARGSPTALTQYF